MPGFRRRPQDRMCGGSALPLGPGWKSGGRAGRLEAGAAFVGRAHAFSAWFERLGLGRQGSAGDQGAGDGRSLRQATRGCRGAGGKRGPRRARRRRRGNGRSTCFAGSLGTAHARGCNLPESASGLSDVAGGRAERPRFANEEYAGSRGEVARGGPPDPRALRCEGRRGRPAWATRGQPATSAGRVSTAVRTEDNRAAAGGERGPKHMGMLLAGGTEQV